MSRLSTTGRAPSSISRQMSPIVVYFTALVSRCSFLFIILSFGRMPNTISIRSFSVILLSERHAMRMSFTISTLFMISSR